MENKEVRSAISASGLKYWQIADEIGIADSTFTKWLRKELPADKHQLVMEAIKNLKREKSK